MIQAYAPTSSHNDEEVEELYAEITKTMERNSHDKIIMGVFNTKIGQHHQSDGATVGKFRPGERHTRGTRLTICNICNTFFKKRKSKKWTWKSPNGVTKNEIDYIPTNKNIV